MSEPRSRFLSTCEWVTAGLITAIALCLHLVRVRSAGPLWRDEVAVLNLARMNWHEIVFYFPHEGFPPPFLALLREYAGFLGTSDTALRVFGLCAGIACLGMVWLNAALTTRRAPLLALALFGFSPVLFVWGDSIRGYGLGAALIMLTFALFARAIVKPSPGVFLAALVSAVLSVQCLLANAVLLFALGISAMVVLIFQGRIRHARIVLGIGFAAALSITPYIGSYRNGREWDVVFRTQLSLAWLWRKLCDALGKPAPGMLSVWWILLVLAPIGVIWLLRHNSAGKSKATPLTGFAFVSCALALVGYLVFLKALGYPTQDWYYLSLIAVLVLGLDIVAGVLAGRLVWVAVLRLALAVGVTAAVAAPAFNQAQKRMSNLDLVASELKRRAAPQDFILVAPWYLGISFRSHLPIGMAWETLPPMRDLRIHRYDLLKEQMTLPDPLEPLRRRIAHTLRSGHRLWIVGALTYPEPGRKPPFHAPAPHDRVGWSEFAYSTAWSMQLGLFVETHGLRSLRVELAVPTPINVFENAQLTAVEGWRGE